MLAGPLRANGGARRRGARQDIVLEGGTPVPRPLRDSLYIYGFHDPGGEQIMLDAGVPGWVLVTEAIGHDPNNRTGGDYRGLSDRELGVIVRLNNGYNPDGTLPFEREYANFARRCANFVAASQGAHLWIIGNETNHPIEWPGAVWNWGPGWPAPVSPDKRGEEITPVRYASCYRQCRNAIKAVPGHEGDQVLVAAPAPWNILLTYPGNPNGDWVKYFSDMLAAVGAGNLDGITLHTYTHGASPALITSEEKMGDPRFAHLRYHFRAYMDFMAVIPQAMRSLPVYITESNQGDQAWENANTGWVRAAYTEIDRWNRASAQKIRNLLLYRWPQVPGDRWGIEGKAGVIEDFRGALGARYQWSVGEDQWAALRRRVTELEAAAAALEDEIVAVNKAALEAAALRKDAEALQAQINAMKPADLARQLDALEAQIKALEDALNGPVPDGHLQIVYKIGQLPAGTGAYPTRDESAIKRVVVHHTVTPGDVTPERLAQAAVGRGLPGIQYHYVVSADGTVYATQPHSAVVAQTNKPEVNADSLAVALAGDFTNVPPPPAQMESAARLIADLLMRYKLPTSAVVGRRELEATGSPGNQWMAGAKYKDPLLARAQAIIDAEATPDVPALKRRIAELEAQVAGLNAQIAALTRDLDAANKQKADLQGQLSASQAQVSALQARITQLETTVQQQAAEIERLKAQLGGSTPGRVAKPAVVDMVDKLPKHPTLPPYGKRTRPISMIVVHHTDTPKTTTVQSIAQYHVFGERKNAQGEVIKAQWPGVGYHFLVDPQGVIYQGQRESTRSYHVGGDPNDYSVAISLIGRFMRKNYDGTDRPPEDQVPTPQQLRSAGQLAAWLMQEHNVKEDQIKGHRDVWPKATVCPGEHWKSGLNWYPRLIEEVRTAQQGGTAPVQRMQMYLLFWDHAPLTGGAAWAEADWRSAQGYIARFRPTTGFSVADAMLAQNVVIVGGEAGVSGADETRLRQAGATVHRLAGKDEADTKRMLDELAQKGTPWPGAPVQPVAQPREFEAFFEGGDTIIFPDEWTMPDGWTVPEEALPESHPQQPSTAYPKTLEELLGTGSGAGADPPQIPKVFPPAPGEQEEGRE
jgi:N-acetyl-anhydromuramyl-L-alanine amidase AmpD